MEKRLEQILEEKSRMSGADRERLEKSKEEWIARIESLYREIEGWLKPLVDKGQLDIQPRDYEITEEMFGTYFPRKLNIRFKLNGRLVELLPKGRHIVGANGRIDMHLGGKIVMILGKENGAGWEFVEAFGGPGRGPSHLPLTRENFESLLADFAQSF